MGAENQVENFDNLETIVYRGGNNPKPAKNPNRLRLYQHNLCPFSARTRYVFSAKGVPFQRCETDLNDKAPWHVEANGGSAPLLETPQGDLIPESGICMQFAQDSNPNGGIQLFPSDPVQAAKLRLRMDKFGKLLPNMFGVILSRG